MTSSLSRASFFLCVALAWVPTAALACPLPLSSRCLLDGMPERAARLKTQAEQREFVTTALFEMATTPLAQTAVRLVGDRGLAPGGPLLRNMLLALAKQGVDLSPLLPMLTEQLLPEGMHGRATEVYDHAVELVKLGAQKEALPLLVDLGGQPPLQRGHWPGEPRRDVLMVSNQLRAIGSTQEAQRALVSEAERLLRMQEGLSGYNAALRLADAAEVAAELHLLGDVSQAEAFRRQIEVASLRLGASVAARQRLNGARYLAYLLSLEHQVAQQLAADVGLDDEAIAAAEQRLVFRYIHVALT